MSTVIQFRRGPYTFFETIAAAYNWGEPYLAHVPVGDGSALELLFAGSYGEPAQLVGGGFQVLTSLPGGVPNGACALDTNFNLWTFANGNWQQIAGTRIPANIVCARWV